MQWTGPDAHQAPSSGALPPLPGRRWGWQQPKALLPKTAPTSWHGAFGTLFGVDKICLVASRGWVNKN